MKKQKGFTQTPRRVLGFTLIELLVVIAIIGLLSTLAVVALNNARQKSRDARRVSDIKQVQTALELYYNDEGGYPSVGTAAALGETGYLCLDEDGFAGTCPQAAGNTVYMGQVPDDPDTTYDNYNYCSTTAAAPTTCAASTESYMIVFGLEGATGGLTCETYSAICCRATPSGITCS